MPKKTKKQKLEAHRRRLLQAKKATSSTLANSKIENVKLETGKAPMAKQEIRLSKEEMQTKSYFISDLRKSLILIALIIIVEFLLYFASIFGK